MTRSPSCQSARDVQADRVFHDIAVLRDTGQPAVEIRVREAGQIGAPDKPLLTRNGQAHLEGRCQISGPVPQGVAPIDQHHRHDARMGQHCHLVAV